MARAHPAAMTVNINISDLRAYAVKTVQGGLPASFICHSSMNYVTHTATTPVKSVNILLVNTATEIINNATKNLCVLCVSAVR